MSPAFCDSVVGGSKEGRQWGETVWELRQDVCREAVFQSCDSCCNLDEDHDTFKAIDVHMFGMAGMQEKAANDTWPPNAVEPMLQDVAEGTATAASSRSVASASERRVSGDDVHYQYFPWVGRVG